MQRRERNSGTLRSKRLKLNTSNKADRIIDYRIPGHNTKDTKMMITLSLNVWDALNSPILHLIHRLQLRSGILFRL